MILYFLFFSVPETAQSQVKATLDPRGESLELQIHQHAGIQETSVTVIRKHQCFLSIQTCLTRNSGILIKFGYLPAHCKTFNSLRN